MNPEIFTLKRDTSDLAHLLMSGDVIRHGERWIALPREVISLPVTGGKQDGAKREGRSLGRSGSVVFELVRFQDLHKPSGLDVFIKAIRPESLGLSLSPCLATLFYSLHMKWVFDWRIALTSILGAVLFQVAVNALNDVEDHLRLIDLPGTLGGSGVIQRGWMSARQLRVAGFVALGLGALFGLPAVFSQPPALLMIGVLGFLGVLGYSGKPFEMKYRVIGDLCTFTLLGPLLTLGFSLALTGRIDISVALLGCFYGFLSWAVLHANNLQDIEFDLDHGIETLASQLGFRISRYLLVSLYALSFVSLVCGWKFGNLPLALSLGVLASLPYFLKVFFRIFQASGPASALLSRIRGDAYRFHWFLSALLSLGFLLSYIV